MKYFFRKNTILSIILLIGCEGTITEDCATTETGRGHVISVLPLGTISASYLTDFLKDNNISCLPVDGNPLSELMKNMPFSEEDNIKYNSFQKN